jgi:hypothetical protein
MKKLIFLSLLFCSISSLSLGQILVGDTIYNKVILGVLPNGAYSESILENDGKDRAIIFSITPIVYASYNLHKNLYIGADFGYEIFSSNYYQKRSFVEVDVLARYWIPFTINHRFFKRFRLYVQASYGWSNYIIKSETIRIYTYKTLEIHEDFIIHKDLDFNKYAFPVGLTFKIKRYMYAEMNWQYVKFVNGKGRNGFTAGIGFNIGQKNNAVKKVF